MSLLEPREAYRLWAASYETGNPVTHLDEQLVRALGPSPAGLRLLDAGCGTGWRMAHSGAARAVGVDLSREMLAVGGRNAALGGVVLLEGDLRALPVPDAAFDLVWCRLAIGYVADCAAVYAELARAAVPGGHVVVTDFHPAAHAAGYRRTFSHRGRTHEVSNHPHSAEQHLEAAHEVSLDLRGRVDGAIGPEVRFYYEANDREALYHEQLGQPFVLALAFTRGG